MLTRCPRRSSGGAPVGTPDAHRLPATVGFELSKDGKTVVFTKAKFLDALQNDPALAQRMVSGRDAGTDSSGNARHRRHGSRRTLLDVAKSATDSATGSLVKLAEGKEVDAQGHPGAHRRLGPPPGQAQGDADPPVHRHGDIAQLAAQPVHLAGRPDQLAALRLIPILIPALIRTRPPHTFPSLQEFSR